MAIRTLGDTRSRSGAYVVAGVLALALSGCTGGGDDPAPTDAAASTPTDASTQDASVDDAATESETADGETAEAGDEDAGGELGTITIDTTTYQVLESANCTPVSPTDLVTRVLDVLAVARSRDGEDALFFAYTEDQSGVSANHIDYQGPEGTLSTRDGNASFSFESGTFSGAGTLVDDAETKTLMAQFNFTVPDELVDC